MLTANCTNTFTGSVVDESTFRFSCGFEVPLEQIQGFVDAHLLVKDVVTFSIINVKIHRVVKSALPTTLTMQGEKF